MYFTSTESPLSTDCGGSYMGGGVMWGSHMGGSCGMGGRVGGEVM